MTIRSNQNSNIIVLFDNLILILVHNVVRCWSTNVYQNMEDYM